MPYFKQVFSMPYLVIFAVILGVPSLSWAEKTLVPMIDKTRNLPISPKEKVTIPKSFRIGKVTFQEVLNNNQKYLAVAVEFNHPVDRSSIVPGNNFRLMKENNGFWVDAYPLAGSNLRVVNNVVTWIMGTPAVDGNHRLHARGTIRDTSGAYLDCNNDGIAEMGNLPAYDSQVYRVGPTPLEIIERP